MSPDARRPTIRLRSAAALVVANMIGVGIFTTTGFQAEVIDSPLTIYVLWIVGGVVALCGALCYSELGAAMPSAGGEYVYLREAYGGSFAFMSALVSLTAGFSAPIAAALKGFAAYFTRFLPQLDGEAVLVGGITLNDGIAVALVWMLVAVHSRPLRTGIGVNDWLTLIKVAGIVLIILAAAAFGKGELAGIWRESTIVPAQPEQNGFSALGTSLIFVMFCYSGWNAAAYLAEEIESPQRNLPTALLAGTLLVAGLYLCLNVVYFYGASIDELAGEVEVGLIAARGLFGPVGVTLTVGVLLISLLASASAMTIAGPRVYYAAGRDAPALRFLAGRRAGDTVPIAALLLQGVVATLIILAGTVDQIQQYAGFTLTLFATLAIVSVFVLRWRRPELHRPFRVWAYPLPPLIFVIVSCWMMYWAFQGRPVESLLGLATVAAGGLLHRFWIRGSR